MKIIKQYLSAQLQYESLQGNKPIIEVGIDDGNIIINYKKIITTHWTLGNLNENQIAKIISFLKVGMFKKAPCGGFVNFYKVIKDNDLYIIYTGIREKSNSAFIVTVHGIILVEDGDF